MKSAPAVPMTAHEQALAVAGQMYDAGEPLERWHVDALVRELSMRKAELMLVRRVAEQTANVLDRFAEVGLKLERVDSAPIRAGAFWTAQTANGWVQGANPWDALQKAVKLQAEAVNVTRALERVLATL